MALLGNFSVLAKTPGRWIAGSSTAGGNAAQARSNYNKNADWRNFSLQAESVPSTVLVYAAKPQGYYPQGAYALPTTSGMISAVNFLLGSGALSAAGAMGLNAESSVTGAGALSATGQLVVSGSSTIPGVGTLSANIVAALAGASSISGSGALSGTIVAVGFAASSLTGSGSLSITSYAVGHMEAEIVPPVLLEAESFSSYILDTEIIETGLTVREALRLISAATAGKVSGGGTSTVTIRNAVADTKDRIIADVDTDGNRTSITYDKS